MPAAVETLGSLATFASRKEPAWHGLGTVFAEDTDMSTRDMLKTAHMHDWNVRLVALQDVTDFDSYAQESYLVVRDNPFNRDAQDVLAVVGSRYSEVQNETVFAFGDNLLDGGGRWETAGSIKGGRVIFGSMSFDDKQIVIDPNGVADKVSTYLLVTSSHDGSAPVSVLFTPTRVVCQNTLNVALKHAQNTYKIRHTLNAKSNVEDARKALGLSFNYFDAFTAEASALFATPVKTDDFWKIVESIYPKPEADLKGAEKKWQNKMDLIESIYTGTASGPDTMSGITGTAWGVANALTERVDYYTGIRAGDTEQSIVRASGFDDNATRERQKIWDTVKAFAGV